MGKTLNHTTEQDDPKKDKQEETDEELIARFIDQISNDEAYLRRLLTKSKGHALSLHVGKTDVETMERALKEADKRDAWFSNSRFDTEQNALTYIRRTLVRNAKDIVDWLKYEPEEDEFDIKQVLDGEITGYGFEFDNGGREDRYIPQERRKKPVIYEYQSDTCRVILARPKPDDELSDDILENFRIPTAHPQMGNKYGARLDTNLQPVVAKTPTYAGSPAAKQVFLDHISRDRKYAIYPATKDDTRIQIYLPNSVRLRRDTILIGETPDKCSVRAIRHDPEHPTPLVHDILLAQYFPDNQAEFPITRAVREVIDRHYSGQLIVVDELYNLIQDKMPTGSPMRHIVAPDPPPPDVETWLRNIRDHRRENAELTEAADAETHARQQKDAKPVARVTFRGSNATPTTVKLFYSETALLAYVRDVVAFRAYSPEHQPTHDVSFSFLDGPRPAKEYKVVQVARERAGLRAPNQESWLKTRQLEIASHNIQRQAQDSEDEDDNPRFT